MLKLAEMFQNGMVLQREMPLHIWGMAEPDAAVTVSVGRGTARAIADGTGAWRAVLPSLPAMENERLIVRTDHEELVLEDLAVGEVWIIAGQSNAEFAMRYEKHLSEEKPNCGNPQIRFYDVPEIAFDGQRECFDYSSAGLWRKASPEEIEYFSAVGYYLAQKLEAELNVPVGIIGCNWGGSVSASWMNPETVRAAGPEWMREYEIFAAAVDWDDYWARQRVGAQNDRGNLLSDPFNEFVMPKTHTQAEIQAFFAQMTESGTLPDIRDGEVLPFHIPGALYTHMVKPLAPYAVRGVAWYQGESDDEMHRAQLYEAMLKGLITDWRKLWGDTGLPFLIVQLPGYESWLMNVNERYDIIRDAQETVARTVENTWLCSISDIGEQYDIHPKNKRDVGQRLALLALGHLYGKQILCDAPSLRNAIREGTSLTLTFDHAEGGLTVKGKTIQALSVSSSGETLAYRSEIQENRLLIRLEKTCEQPIRVDFAKEKFFCVNLYNQAGIPAIPFSCII